MTTRIPVRIRTADIDPDPTTLEAQLARNRADQRRLWALSGELNASVYRALWALQQQQGELEAGIRDQMIADMALNRAARRRKDVA